jgi:hypothetical protein
MRPIITTSADFAIPRTVVDWEAAMRWIIARTAFVPHPMIQFLRKLGWVSSFLRDAKSFFLKKGGQVGISSTRIAQNPLISRTINLIVSKDELNPLKKTTRRGACPRLLTAPDKSGFKTRL